MQTQQQLKSTILVVNIIVGIMKWLLQNSNNWMDLDMKVNIVVFSYVNDPAVSACIIHRISILGIICVIHTNIQLCC